MSPEAASSLSQPRRFGSSAGQPLTRRDGLLKVTGRATYAADNHPEGMLYAVTTVSSIARGKVKALDVAAAKSHPGVVEVMTPANRPPLAHDCLRRRRHMTQACYRTFQAQQAAIDASMSVIEASSRITA